MRRVGLYSFLRLRHSRQPLPQKRNLPCFSQRIPLVIGPALTFVPIARPFPELRRAQPSKPSRAGVVQLQLQAPNPQASKSLHEQPVESLFPVCYGRDEAMNTNLKSGSRSGRQEGHLASVANSNLVLVRPAKYRCGGPLEMFRIPNPKLEVELSYRKNSPLKISNRKDLHVLKSAKSLSPLCKPQGPQPPPRVASALLRQPPACVTASPAGLLAPFHLRHHLIDITCRSESPARIRSSEDRAWPLR
jgi:hypothetical protein